MELYDAHRHLHSQNSHCDLPVRCVVNGTQPSDWPEVIKASGQDTQIIPAIGLHPWQVNDAPSDWQASFLAHISKARAIGEIGLDQWIEGYDIQRQESAFTWQLKQAADRNLPVSIHCLKATSALIELLKTQARPERGIHLHAYSGSAEQLAQLTDLGAYFSFHASQLNSHAKKAPRAVRAIRADRLLIETDAPDTLKKAATSNDYLLNAYKMIAKLRGVALESLSEQVSENFNHYFLND